MACEIPAEPVELLCQEDFTAPTAARKWNDGREGYCGRPATHRAGVRSGLNGWVGYPACERCAGFWGDEYSRRLTKNDLELIAWAQIWIREQQRTAEANAVA